jgi:hypothetical protein
MFGWARNSRIVIIFGIKITVVYPNINLLFRTVRITVILLFYGEDKIAVIFINTSLLFSTNNPNNIFLPFEIALSFYYSRAK